MAAHDDVSEPGHEHRHPHQPKHGHADHAEHAEHAGHPHGHAAETQPSTLGLGAPVLDIGGDIGALVLYTPEQLAGVEIEVSPTTDPDHRTHTQIHKRTVNGRTFWAGVYAQLLEGDYRVWWDDTEQPRSFTITGGTVTELDWR